MYHDILRVHLMSLYLQTLHGFKGTSTNMKRHFLTVDAIGIQVCQDCIGKMKSCRRSCHTTLDLRINRLVGRLVALLRLTVQIWRNRQLTYSFQDFCERNVRIVPFEIYPIVGTATDGYRSLLAILATLHGDREGQLVSLDFKLTMQAAFLPLLQVADHTEPSTMSGCLEHQLIVGWLSWLHQEDLYQCTCLLAEAYVPESPWCY